MSVVPQLLSALSLLTLLSIRSGLGQCCLKTQTDPGAIKLTQLGQTLEAVECDLVDSVTYPDYSPYNGEVFDFIVVGAGSAGSVVASRLSENPAWRVLLLEAGGDPDLTSEFPSLSATLRESHLDWNYTTEPGSRYCLGSANQRCKLPRGKVLGGSSTINYMNYNRGHPELFNSWEREGNRGWGYKDLLPYFKKSEDLESEEVRENKYFPLYHGEDGNLTVETFYQDCGVKMIFHQFSEAYSELGYPTFPDINANFHDGLYYLQGTVRDGRRCSTAKAFLKPAQYRKNLKISKLSLAKKVLVNTYKAYGVLFEKCGVAITVRARKEVIVSAGAINSPQLLMLSGIGPRDHLEDLGLQVISDLPVGYNLQDHYLVRGCWISLSVDLLKPDDKKAVLDVVFRSKATAQVNGRFNAAGYLTTSKAAFANIMYFYSLYAVNSTDVINKDNEYFGFEDKFKQAISNLNRKKSIFLITPVLVKGKSTGRIILKSANPKDYPLIFPNFLSETEDMEALLECVQFANRLMNTEAMKKFGARMERIDIPGCRPFKFQTDEYWKCVMMYAGVSFYHPAGTCRMGPRGSSLSVVDPTLQVIGVSGLRVVDCSVMPSVTNGNLNAPIIAMAEKAADIIKRVWT